MSEKILIFGGSGFIGRSLASELAKKHDVSVFDNNQRGYRSRDLDIPDVRHLTGDIRKASDVLSACEGYDAIFNLAYINGTQFFYEKPELVLQVAVAGQLNVVNAVNTLGTKTFVYASSSEVYQLPSTIPTPEDVQLVVPDVTNPRFSYGGGKIIGELMTLHQVSKETRRLIFRPHNIYGPCMGWEHVIPQIVKRIFEYSNQLSEKHVQIDIEGDGQETRAFCYVEDAARAVGLIYEQGTDSGIYHVGVMEEITIESLIREIGTAMGVHVEIVPGPLKRGSVRRRCPDNQKCTSLGFEAQISLSEGVKRTVNWYVERLKEGVEQ